MYANQLAEHIAHSEQDNSRWDGFDRGTTWADEQWATERCIGRMTNEAGQRVVINETSFSDSSDRHYAVLVDNAQVFSAYDDKARAVTVARWWMAGCPA